MSQEKLLFFQESFPCVSHLKMQNELMSNVLLLIMALVDAKFAHSQNRRQQRRALHLVNVQS